MVGSPAHRVERKESQDEVVMVVMSDVPIVFLAPITSQSAPATQHQQKLKPLLILPEVSLSSTSY